MQLTFFGATGTVTGSKALVEAADTRVLVDCGMFQGLKKLRLRNWDAPPFDLESLDAVVLTHAHIDHSGYLPRLVKRGFTGPVYCTEGTAELLRIMLPDSAHILEEDAKYANKKGFTRHQPAVPLYTRDDVDRTLALMVPKPFSEFFEVGGLRVRFDPAGHILGASTVRIEAPEGAIGFTGDVGRPNDVLMRAPKPLDPVDWLVTETTYGDRRHPEGTFSTGLAAVATRVLSRGGVLMIPAFAVGRSQAVLHLLQKGIAAGEIPRVPVYLDSPMAINVTEIFWRRNAEHRLSREECAAMGGVAEFVREAEGSKALDRRDGPMVIVAASGMISGGRILHHLKRFAPEPKNAILLVGYQAAGTRGEALKHKAEELKIHGTYVTIGCEVVSLDGLSAHADWRELLDWLKPLPAPKRTFLVHGNPSASDRMRVRIQDELGWRTTQPTYGHPYRLD